MKARQRCILAIKQAEATALKYLPPYISGLSTNYNLLKPK